MCMPAEAGTPEPFRIDLKRPGPQPQTKSNLPPDLEAALMALDQGIGGNIAVPDYATDIADAYRRSVRVAYDDANENTGIYSDRHFNAAPHRRVPGAGGDQFIHHTSDSPLSIPATARHIMALEDRGMQGSDPLRIWEHEMLRRRTGG